MGIITIHMFNWQEVLRKFYVLLMFNWGSFHLSESDLIREIVGYYAFISCLIPFFRLSSFHLLLWFLKLFPYTHRVFIFIICLSSIKNQWETLTEIIVIGKVPCRNSWTKPIFALKHIILKFRLYQFWFTMYLIIIREMTSYWQTIVWRRLKLTICGIMTLYFYHLNNTIYYFWLEILISLVFFVYKYRFLEEF